MCPRHLPRFGHRETGLVTEKGAAFHSESDLMPPTIPHKRKQMSGHPPPVSAEGNLTQTLSPCEGDKVMFFLDRVSSSPC